MDSEDIYVSIACITYNHGNFIRDALESFLMQKTNFPFEILIHDDASTDHTQEIIKEYEKKYPGIIKPIYQKENQLAKIKSGIMFIYNFSRAKGKYIAYCEGDDYWLDPYKLQKQVDFLDSHPSYSACFHAYMPANENGRILKPYRFLNISDASQEDLIFARKSLFNNTLVFRNYFKTGELVYPECFRGVYGGDAQLFHLLGTKGPAKHMDNIAASVYRLHSDGIFTGVKDLRKNAERFVLLASALKTHASSFMDQKKLQEFDKMSFLLSRRYLQKMIKKGKIIDLAYIVKKVYKTPNLSSTIFIKELLKFSYQQVIDKIKKSLTI
ncbi:MAG: glycosyl transferase [Vicingaceae bacterium]|nr:MAG: glycosyl transferase [Bacteroidia bacterium]GIV41806.1 MAG: glycosyl transferase [Vicingaceae bacterium]